MEYRAASTSSAVGEEIVDGIMVKRRRRCSGCTIMIKGCSGFVDCGLFCTWSFGSFSCSRSSEDPTIFLALRKSYLCMYSGARGSLPARAGLSTPSA